MFIQQLPHDFREWQIKHYEERLQLIPTAAGINFIADNLINFLTPAEC